MNRGRRSGSWARWGWLVTTLALGAVVIASAWSNYRSVRSAASDLIRGQAQIFRDVVIATNRHVGEGRPDFDSLVSAQRDAGLRFAAWIGEGGVPIASGGDAAPAPIGGSDVVAQPEIVRLESRVRAYFPPPSPPQPPGGPPAAPAGGARGERSERAPSGSLPDSVAPPRRGPPMIVLEFEPVVADDMVARALRSLLIAGIVAAVLTAAGVAFWRMSQRIEAGERRMAEQRRLLALGEMAAVLAHEIRNPLASLKGHAQLMVERLPDDATARRRAHRVVEEATRLEALTSDLLDFTRSGPLNLEPTDPAALLRASVAELGDTRIEVDAAGAPDRWPLDQRRVRHAVLVNLLRNALQASPPDRPPRARAAIENGSLVFTVRDFGPGLPSGSEDRIFDPFFTTRATGTGLGLAVARRIVELHGGHIDAANDPDGGAIFRVELPRGET